MYSTIAEYLTSGR